MTDSGKATKDASPPAGDDGSSGAGNPSSEESNVEWAQQIQENSQMSSAAVPSSTQSNKCCLSTPNASVDSFLFGRTHNYIMAPNKHLPEHNSTITNTSTTPFTTTGSCADPMGSSPPSQHLAPFYSEQGTCDKAGLLQHEPWTVDDAASAFSSMHFSPTISQVACSPYHAAASVEQWKGAKLPTPSENPLGWQNLDRLACLLLSRVRNGNLRQRRASLVFIFITLERVVSRGSASARRHALYRWKTCLGLSTPAMIGAVPESTRAQMLRLDEVLQDVACSDNSKRNDTVSVPVGNELGATSVNGTSSYNGNEDGTDSGNDNEASSGNGYDGSGRSNGSGSVDALVT
eukprot:GHVS01045466.1.p1 GENE.GHVS01045466.1~~GHVS01045466.1.p1  ORF type:complete len:347 (-),score=57.19 GHVS01045466.1:100-1140(-)